MPWLVSLQYAMHLALDMIEHPSQIGRPKRINFVNCAIRTTLKMIVYDWSDRYNALILVDQESVKKYR